MKVVLLFDFGSTYTKVLAIDIESETLIGRAQSLTTVDADITIGMRRAYVDLLSTYGIRESDIVQKFASSSAAGGLKLAAIGLVPALTLEAARRAALGAGAKVVWSSGFELDAARIRSLEALRPDIVLLCGGTDGGDKRIIQHNAGMLSASALTAPILVVGNNVVTEDIGSLFRSAGKICYTAENVLPQLSALNIEPAKGLIRDVFIQHITKAKGLSEAQDFIGTEIIPTPKATLQAASLIADGIDGEAGIGALLIVEIGGATINIHSVSNCGSVDPATILRGLPESRLKRTVEGDLGIRYNAATILDLVGIDALMKRVSEIRPDTKMNGEQLTQKVLALSANVGLVPDANPDDDCVDYALAKCAALLAVSRHAGTIKTEYSLAHEVKVQHGKDLTQIPNVIGTGGLFKYGKWPRHVLEAALYDNADPASLRPRTPQFWMDHDYVMYGVGLLVEHHPALGLHIAKKYLVPT